MSRLFHSVAAVETALAALGGEASPAAPAPATTALASPEDRARILRALQGAANPADLDRSEWVRLAHAVKATCGEDGREPFLEWSGRWEGGDDAGEAEALWDGAKPKGGAAAGTVWHILTEHCGVSPTARVFDPVQADAAPAQDAGARFPFAPFKLRDLSAYPPRRRIHGDYVRGFLFLLVAPGGAGKSALATTTALAMVSGRPLDGESPVRPLRVAVFNGEDPREEVEKRFGAAAKRFELETEALGDRLLILSGRDAPMKLVAEGRDGVHVAEEVVAAFVAALRAARVDVLVVDPLVTVHTCRENDNTAMNAVADVLRRVAHEADCAVIAVHHAGKGARLHSAEMGIDQARGASALVDAARGARFLVPMSLDEAARFGIAPEERWRFFRVETGKANLAPQGGAARWYRKASVALGNFTPDYPAGDNIGVVETWEPPAVREDASADDMSAILARLRDGEWRANEQSGAWAGYAAAEVLALDVGSAKGRTPEQTAARERVKAVLGIMRQGGSIRVERRPDGRNGRTAPFVVPVAECVENASAPSAPRCGEGAEGAEQ